jgi:hypothetical protein
MRTSEILDQLKAEFLVADKQRRIMHSALRLIIDNAGGTCERMTSGPGSCWQHYNRKSKHADERWCNSCVALDAINQAGRASDAN